MKISMLKLCLFGLLAAGIAGASGSLRAQDTNNAAAGKKPASPRHHAVTPFHGHLKSINTTAQTITVGDVTIHITSETKIDKSGKPAILQDGAVGELVSGGYTKTAEGKCVATTLHLGPRETARHPKAATSGAETK
jgi:hypothetical protein